MKVETQNQILLFERHNLYVKDGALSPGSDCMESGYWAFKRIYRTSL